MLPTLRATIPKKELNSSNVEQEIKQPIGIVLSGKYCPWNRDQIAHAARIAAFSLKVRVKAVRYESVSGIHLIPVPQCLRRAVKTGI